VEDDGQLLRMIDTLTAEPTSCMMEHWPNVKQASMQPSSTERRRFTILPHQLGRVVPVLSNAISWSWHRSLEASQVFECLPDEDVDARLLLACILVRAILKLDPKDRLTARDILHMPFLGE
jgi:hypothetical protein